MEHHILGVRQGGDNVNICLKIPHWCLGKNFAKMRKFYLQKTLIDLLAYMLSNWYLGIRQRLLVGNIFHKTF
jgi:hypothetical protein